eukprot:GGOE01014216.1.p1 GENE.GGOE01014216.1~~GGOE01014216.1.p1  ORF type:complete len:632 (-),score=140.75 GGOE01014216.1:148-1815(-)
MDPWQREATPPWRSKLECELSTYLPFGGRSNVNTPPPPAPLPDLVLPPCSGITYVNQGRSPTSNAVHGVMDEQRKPPFPVGARSLLTIVPPSTSSSAGAVPARDATSSPSDTSALTPSSRGSYDAMPPFHSFDVVLDPLPDDPPLGEAVALRETERPMDIDSRTSCLGAVPGEAPQVPPCGGTEQAPTKLADERGSSRPEQGSSTEQPQSHTGGDTPGRCTDTTEERLVPSNSSAATKLPTGGPQHRLIRSLLVSDGESIDGVLRDLPAATGLIESRLAVQEAFGALLQAVDGFDAVQRALQAVVDLRKPLPANPVTPEEDARLQAHRDTLGQLQLADGDVPEERLRKSRRALETRVDFVQGLAAIIQRAEDQAAESFSSLFTELTQQSQSLSNKTAALNDATKSLIAKSSTTCEQLRAERLRESEQRVNPLRTEIAETLRDLESFRDNYLLSRSNILDTRCGKLKQLLKEAEKFDPLDEDLGAHRDRITDLERKVEEVSEEVNRLRRQCLDTDALRVKLRIPRQRGTKRPREPLADDTQPAAQRRRMEWSCIIS